jgi:hypothetical protein
MPCKQKGYTNTGDSNPCQGNPGVKGFADKQYMCKKQDKNSHGSPLMLKPPSFVGNTEPDTPHRRHNNYQDQSKQPYTDKFRPVSFLKGKQGEIFSGNNKKGM